MTVHGETAGLLLRIRAGDEEAWTPLFERFHGRLRLYVRHRLGRALGARVEVEDVVQETWLRAFAAVEGFEAAGESAFLRFLTTLARHVIADLARAARAAKRDGRERRLDRTAWSTAGGAAAVAARTRGPATRVEAAEEARLLEEAFARLSPEHRVVIALRQFEQLPAAEVAARTGRTTGAVHALYRRALTAWGAEFEAGGGRLSTG